MHLEITLRMASIIVALTVAIGTVSTSRAVDSTVPAQTMQFDIRSQPVNSALQTLAMQAHQEILFTPEIAKDKTTQSVKGVLTVDAALSQLLSGTGLSFSRSTAGMILVSQADAKGASASSGPPGALLGARNDQSPNENTPPQENNNHLEEIVVTARRRNESFLDVPVMATVLSGDALEQTKTDNLYDLASRVPSLLLGDSVNSTGTQLSLRGVGTMALDATIDQSVLLDVDGVPMSQALAYSVALFDAADVEVFNGPQPLYFGKNSTAGVISMRSADPTDKLERIATVGYDYEAGDKQVDLIFSGPVSDTLKLRLASRYDYQDGFFRNVAVVPPSDVDLGGVTPTYQNLAPSQELILRGTALFQPNDLLTARLKVNYDDYNAQEGSPLEITLCPSGTGGVPPLNIAFIAGAACQISRNFAVPWFNPAAFPGTIINGGVPYTGRTQQLDSLELNFHVATDLTLTSITGFYHNDFKNLQAANVSTISELLSAYVTYSNRQFTQEIRIASAYTDRPVNFMAGAFLNNGRQTNDVLVGGDVLFGLPGVIQDPRFIVDNHSYSLFGEATWDIVPKLELSVGARWTDETRTMTEYNYGPAQGPIGVVSRPDPLITSAHTSPEVTLTYKPTDTLTTYGTYKTGYKSGSYNTISFVPSNEYASFHDEKAEGGEVGIKTQTHDHRLTAQIAVYDYKYLGLQVGALNFSQLTGGVFAPFLQTLNAAAATVKGVDFNVSYAPAVIDGLTLTGAGNFNHARYTSFPNAPCGNGQTIAEGCNQLFDPTTGLYSAQNLAGRPLVRAPDFSSNVGFNYGMPVHEEMKLTFGANANYVSQYTTVVPDLPGFVQPSYVKVDANIALHGKDDRWQLAFIGIDLNNRLTTGWCANAGLRNGIFGGQIAGGPTSGPAGSDNSTCYVQRGRQLWGRLTVEF
jgi:iron complex outermembrane recepter protein